VWLTPLCSRVKAGASGNSEVLCGCPEKPRLREKRYCVGLTSATHICGQVHLTFATYIHMFCSLAIFNPRVGHTMDILSPFISILSHCYRLFHRESCPHLDVVYPGRVWSSSPACTWHCSLHYFFLQAIPLFPHGMSIVC